VVRNRRCSRLLSPTGSTDYCLCPSVQSDHRLWSPSSSSYGIYGKRSASDRRFVVWSRNFAWVVDQQRQQQWGCSWNGGYGQQQSVKYNNNVYVTNNNVYPGRLRPTGHPMGDIRVQLPATTGALSGHQGQPTMAVALTIVLTTLRFLRRVLTTKRPQGRPIRISPNLIFPRAARCLTIRAVRI